MSIWRGAISTNHCHPEILLGMRLGKKIEAPFGIASSNKRRRKKLAAPRKILNNQITHSLSSSERRLLSRCHACVLIEFQHLWIFRDRVLLVAINIKDSLGMLARSTVKETRGKRSTLAGIATVAIPTWYSYFAKIILYLEFSLAPFSTPQNSSHECILLNFHLESFNRSFFCCRHTVRISNWIYWQSEFVQFKFVWCFVIYRLFRLFFGGSTAFRCVVFLCCRFISSESIWLASVWWDATRKFNEM